MNGFANRIVPSPSPPVLTITELTRQIKLLLEAKVGYVWVEGEISNLKTPLSGHRYFILKDEGAQIAAVQFRGDQRDTSFVPQNGVRVRVYGQVSVYERTGVYQIIVRRMEPAGWGALYARFLALKEKLKQEGLFAAERKRPIPMLPQHVGIVTSPVGAAIRDILNILDRRYPNLHIVLAPVRVQGEGAAEEIAAAIADLNRWGGLDVVIVGRGGGSWEDLWCFNEEIVARAIAASAIPIISAVGHEVDSTISDYVADLRAPTPSAAAELLVGRKDDFQTRLNHQAKRLSRALMESVRLARSRWRQAAVCYAFREPLNVVRQHAQRLDGLALRAQHAITSRLADRQREFHAVQVAFGTSVQKWYQKRCEAIHRLRVHIDALNPMAVLRRGYSVTWDSQGRILRSAAQVQKGQRVRTRLAEGEIYSTVIDAPPHVTKRHAQGAPNNRKAIP